MSIRKHNVIGVVPKVFELGYLSVIKISELTRWTAYGSSNTLIS